MIKIKFLLTILISLIHRRVIPRGQIVNYKVYKDKIVQRRSKIM